MAAAREIADGELIFAGMGLPLAAFQLAKRTHAPRAVALDVSGVIREHPAASPLSSLAEPSNVRGASMLADLQSVMSLLQQGRVNLGFLEAAEVDRFGNVNAAGLDGSPPRSGSTADLACLARRTIILVRHERHRFPERVREVSGPGYGDGPGWRQRVGLPGGGPAAIITDLAVLRFDGGGEAYLESLHPGVTRAVVQAQTGWPLKIPEGGPGKTAPPTVVERNLLAEIDPEARLSHAAEAFRGPERSAEAR